MKWLFEMLCGKTPSRTFKTEWGRVSGSAKAYNLPRQICIFSLTHAPKKEVILFLLYLGAQSKINTNQLKAYISFFFLALTLRLFFKFFIASSLLLPTKVGPTVLKCQKLYIKLVVGTVRISTLEKQNVDCITESNHEKLSCISYSRPGRVNSSQLKVKLLWHISKRSVGYTLQDKGGSANWGIETYPNWQS